MVNINSGGNTFLINPETGRWAIGPRELVNNFASGLAIDLPEKIYTDVDLFVLNSSNVCNLGCVYCSEETHRSETPRMSFEVAKKMIDQLVFRGSPSKIVFHGSEPTCNLDWVKKVVDYYHNLDDSNHLVSFSIQSNLAILPPGFIEFIKQYNIGVSTSIDGPKEIHDVTRPYLGGKSSFDRILENAHKVLDAQGSLNVATVLTKHNIGHLEEIMQMFENEKFTSWQTIPVQRNLSLSPDPKKLGEEYTRLFEKVFRNIESKTQKIQVRTLAQYLSSMFNHNGIDACRICSSSNIQPLIAIDHDGCIYPCDYFWGEKSAEMGNLFKEGISDLVKSERNIRLRKIKDTSCSSCTWKYNCGGGCLAENKTESDRPLYCATHQKVYHYLAKKMSELVSKDLIRPVLSFLSR